MFAAASGFHCEGDENCRTCVHSGVCLYLWEFKFPGVRALREDADFGTKKDCGSYEKKEA